MIRMQFKPVKLVYIAKPRFRGNLNKKGFPRGMVQENGKGKP
jgi:hypothetical protein